MRSKIKKILRESDDLQWIHDIPLNPFVGEPKTMVIWLDKILNYGETLYIINLLKEAGYRLREDSEYDINKIIEYSKTYGYIRTDIKGKLNYGGDKDTLEWAIDFDDVTIDKEFKATDILPKSLKEEEENDLQWIQDVPAGISHPFLIVNDLDDGIGIQKFLLSLGYTWHSGDNSIRQIYDNTLGYSSLFKENQNSFGIISSALDYDEVIEIAEEIMESKWEEDPDYEYRPNELTIYHWSRLKPNKLNETTNYDKDLDWIDNVPTPIPATELEEWDYFTITSVPDSIMEYIEEYKTKECLFGNTFTIESPIEVDPLFRLYPEHLIEKYNLDPDKMVKNAYLVPTTETSKKDDDEPHHGLKGIWVDLEGVWVNKLS